MQQECKKIAERIAKTCLLEEQDYFDFFIEEINVASKAHIPYDWINSIPYGSEDDKTCKEILEEMEEIEEIKRLKEDEDKKQLKFGFMEKM